MRKVVRILDMSEIELYDFSKTKDNVRKYFAKYRNYKLKLSFIHERLTSSISNDNMGIFSNRINDSTANKVEQNEKIINYIDEMDRHLNIIRKSMTMDEKAILKFSILDTKTDEYIAEYISVAPQNFYQRKKSCYIKVACYFDIDIEKELENS